MSMESAQTWLRNVAAELDELWTGCTDIERLPGDDAWRMLTLRARLAHAAITLEVPALPADWNDENLPKLTAATYPPDHTELLDTLIEYIESDVDPRGPLVDVVLDISDTCAVCVMLGDERSARELAERASAAIALAPERFLDLGGLAELRSVALRMDVPERVVWESIELASGRLLAASLPVKMPLSAADETPDTPTATLAPIVSIRPAARRYASIPQRWVAQAAHTAGKESEGELLDTEGQPMAEWYLEGGVRKLCIRHPASEAEPTGWVLEVVDRATDSVLAETTLPIAREGNYVYVDFGRAGPENPVRALLDRAGASLESVSLRGRLDV